MSLRAGSSKRSSIGRESTGNLTLKGCVKSTMKTLSFYNILRDYYISHLGETNKELEKVEMEKGREKAREKESNGNNREVKFGPI